jgi:hypothetical protein
VNQADRRTGGPARRDGDVVLREIAGETFLVPFRGHLAELQDLFVLNETGLWMWERLDGSRSPRALADQMTAEFDVDRPQAGADVEAFLGRLGEAGLLEWPEAPP